VRRDLQASGCFAGARPGEGQANCGIGGGGGDVFERVAGLDGLPYPLLENTSLPVQNRAGGRGRLRGVAGGMDWRADMAAAHLYAQLLQIANVAGIGSELEIGVDDRAQDGGGGRRGCCGGS
jgi:hypothetical protein